MMPENAEMTTEMNPEETESCNVAEKGQEHETTVEKEESIDDMKADVKESIVTVKKTNVTKTNIGPFIFSPFFYFYFW